jgi:hypothetical protein
MGNIIAWRPDKGSYLEVIYYEIYAWRHCFNRLRQEGVPEIWDEWMFLEGFLLHHRALIEFFSGRHHRGADDLSFADPAVWAGRVVSEREAETFRQPARLLEDRGVWSDISQFLHHCTIRRYLEEKHWPVSQMYDELNPIVIEFENSFPL